jgi:hypothetical protein
MPEVETNLNLLSDEDEEEDGRSPEDGDTNSTLRTKSGNNSLHQDDTLTLENAEGDFCDRADPLRDSLETLRVTLFIGNLW